MPSKVYWLDEPDIMVAEYSGDVTSEDIDAAMAQCMAVLENHSCDFIVDTLQMASLPKDILRIGSLVNLVKHPNRGWLIMVSQQNVMLKFAVQVMRQFRSSRFRIHF